MNTSIDNKKIIFSNKELLFSFFGLLLLALRIPVSTPIQYPTFQPFPTEAPDTVSMVIDAVIGHSLEADLFPDLIGYLLLLVLCLLFIRKTNSGHFYTPLFFLMTALCFSVLNTLLPFLTNGNYRFRLGYLCYFLVVIFKNIAMYQFLKCFTKLSECTSNHAINNITHILFMVAALCGAVREILFFYQLILSSLLYYGVQIILLCYGLYRLWKRKEYIGVLLEETNI